MKTVEPCKTHVAIPGHAGECPWCRCQRLQDELALVKDAFEMAIAVKDYYWEGPVLFSGEFRDISSSTAQDMGRWVERWKIILGEST